MGLVDIFAKKLRKDHRLHAVIPPGATRIDIGDVLIKEKDIFTPMGNISDFGVGARIKPGGRVKLDFQSRGVSITTIQGGVEVSVPKKNLDAKLEISFKNEKGLFVRTPQMKGRVIDNMLIVARKLSKNPFWDHKEFFVASKVFTADGFTILIAKQGNSKLSFLGKGAAILKLITLGLSAGVKRSSKKSAVADFRTTHRSPFAMEIVRVQKNGKPKVVR